MGLPPQPPAAPRPPPPLPRAPGSARLVLPGAPTSLACARAWRRASRPGTGAAAAVAAAPSAELGPRPSAGGACCGGEDSRLTGTPRTAPPPDAASFDCGGVAAGSSLCGRLAGGASLGLPLSPCAARRLVPLAAKNAVIAFCCPPACLPMAGGRVPRSGARSGRSARETPDTGVAAAGALLDSTQRHFAVSTARVRPFCLPKLLVRSAGRRIQAQAYAPTLLSKGTCYCDTPLHCNATQRRGRPPLP